MKNFSSAKLNKEAPCGNITIKIAIWRVNHVKSHFNKEQLKWRESSQKITCCAIVIKPLASRSIKRKHGAVGGPWKRLSLIYEVNWFHREIITFFLAPRASTKECSLLTMPITGCLYCAPFLCARFSHKRNRFKNYKWANRQSFNGWRLESKFIVCKAQN